MFQSKLPRFLALFAILTWSFTTADAQTPVRSAAVERLPMQQRHQVTGSVRAVARGELAALESGRLIELMPKAGHTIRKGDVLARIDTRRLEAQRREIEASIEVAKAELVSRQAVASRAASDLRRAERLLKQNAVSRQEHDLAQADDRVAKAEIEAARRQIERLAESLALIDVRIGDTTIRAPYDATVIRRHAEPGAWVQPGDTLLTLVSSGPVEAWLEVPERYIESLNDFGNDVMVRARAVKTTPTVLSTRRVAEINRRVRTISYVATLENPDGLLTPGMSVDAWIAVTGSAHELTVPKDAVIRDGSSTYVYRVGEKLSAEKVPVRIKFETAQRVAIAAVQLKSGDQVVIEGNERLLPGALLTVTETRPDSTVIAKN